MKILNSKSLIVFITLFAISCGRIGGVGEDIQPLSIKTTTVTGIVFDLNNNPIEGAEVTIMSVPVIVTTDINGFFSATVEIGTHSLEIRVGSILIHSEQIICEENTPLQLSNIKTDYDSDSNGIDNDGDSYTENQGDCNDSDININPGAEEICGDGIDQDCSGSDLICPIPSDEIDDDGDSYTENQGDCNDSDININPGAEEICGDGIDQDCSGSDLICPIPSDEIDDDGDSYTENQGDCNDSDININPGAEEICGDGIDQDCSGSDLICPIPSDEIDDDGDSYTENQGDCNDSDININPGAEEICGDGIDQDCSGSDLICPIDPPEITNPVPGSTLSGPSETFNWTAGSTTVTQWFLFMGSSQGQDNIYHNGDFGGSTSTTVYGLPTDGSTVHVRLWYETPGGSFEEGWEFVDYQYTASDCGCGGNILPAEIISPAPNSILTCEQTFSWIDNGNVVSDYWLEVGSSIGAKDLYESGSLGTSTSTTVYGLPTNGSTVHVRLFYYANGSWHYTDYLYTTPSECG